MFVEDEETLAKLVGLQLKSYGFVVDIVHEGQAVLDKITEHDYDVVLLDRMLPGRSGLDILLELRQKGFGLPVLFVTALNSPEHIVEGLEAGADDYVTKPFDERVLVSRIRSVYRRFKALNSSAEPQSDWLTIADLSINSKSFEAKLGEERLILTRSEFLLLKSLMEERGCVLTRKSLISKVQGEEINVTGRTVDTHIFGLRKKIGKSSDLIETIRGVGYRMKHDES